MAHDDEVSDGRWEGRWCTRGASLIDKALSSVNDRDAETTRCIRRLQHFQVLICAEPNLNANPFLLLTCEAQSSLQFIGQKGSQRKQVVYVVSNHNVSTPLQSFFHNRRRLVGAQTDNLIHLVERKGENTSRSMTKVPFLPLDVEGGFGRNGALTGQRGRELWGDLWAELAQNREGSPLMRENSWKSYLG